MNKKQIIIMAGVGLICFGLSFTVGLFTRTSEEPVVTDGPPEGAQEVESIDPDNGKAATTGPIATAVADNFQIKKVDLGRTISEKKLNRLVYQMSAKVADFTSTEKTLLEKETRIQMAIEELQKNIKEMEDMRLKLSNAVTSIKHQQKILDERLIIIEGVEKNNTIKAALIYDKMKPQQAGEIMVNLIKSNQLDYAVKLTYYMSERTSANLLAEITKNDPSIAANISDKLRWIKEDVEP